MIVIAIVAAACVTLLAVLLLDYLARCRYAWREVDSTAVNLPVVGLQAPPSVQAGDVEEAVLHVGPPDTPIHRNMSAARRASPLASMALTLSPWTPRDMPMVSCECAGAPAPAAAGRSQFRQKGKHRSGTKEVPPSGRPSRGVGSVAGSGIGVAAPAASAATTQRTPERPEASARSECGTSARAAAPAAVAFEPVSPPPPVQVEEEMSEEAPAAEAPAAAGRRRRRRKHNPKSQTQQVQPTSDAADDGVALVPLPAQDPVYRRTQFSVVDSAQSDDTDLAAERGDAPNACGPPASTTAAPVPRTPLDRETRSPLDHTSSWEFRV